MKIKIELFKENIIEAIGAGIYAVIIRKGKSEKVLYIGESVYVLVRCAEHLFELKKNPNYFGFDDTIIEDDEITLVFALIELEEDKSKRKSKEKEYINQKKPLLQSGTSDRMKTIEDKRKLLSNFLKINRK